MRKFHVVWLVAALGVLLILGFGCGSDNPDRLTNGRLDPPDHQYSGYRFTGKAGGPPLLPSAGVLHNATLEALDAKHDLFGGGKYEDADDFVDDLTDAVNEVMTYYNINSSVTREDTWDAVCSCADLARSGTLNWPKDLETDAPGILDPETFFGDLKQQGTINSGDEAWLIGLHTTLLSLPNPDGEDVFDAIILYGAQHGWPLANSPPGVFLDVLLYSSEYWDSQAKRPWWSLGLLTADAAGALIGLAGTPATSILMGGLTRRST